MSFDDQMRATAVVHGAYLKHLVAEGFTRDEAFLLAREHHAAFCWYSMVSEEQAPGWLSDPTSSESPRSTAPALRVLRPNTTEQ